MAELFLVLFLATHVLSLATLSLSTALVPHSRALDVFDTRHDGISVCVATRLREVAVTGFAHVAVARLAYVGRKWKGRDLTTYDTCKQS